MSSRETIDLIHRARDGDEDAMGALVARYRRYLYRIACDQLASDIRPRVDPSDVVQESCLEFHRDLHTFRGAEEAELLAWLKQIVQRNVSNTIRRHVHTAKRTIKKERSLADPCGTDCTLEQQLQADQSTPSKRIRHGEAMEMLERALQQLPKHQGEAVRLRYIHGWTLEQLSNHFERSQMAVAGLLKRGLRALRSQL